MNTWNNLSVRDKADIMKVAIRNGITNLADIKAKYNEFALGGNIYSGTQSGSQQMNQGYVYDVLPNLLAMDGVNVRVSSGYRPDSKTKSGKASRHSTHEAADIIPIKGSTFADIDRVINDPNSNTSKWMMANGYGYIDETSATGTTKYWKDRNKDHSHYHIGRDSMYAKQYAAKIGGGIQNSNMQNGNYRDIAKQHIRQNESWRAKPYADGPNGWRSVGYGFNDSGFYAKYPGGISNYYAQRGGITKEEAEKELDWYLDRMEADLGRTYGSKWDSFNDNQKAAIMDTYYQRPASVGSKSAFYSAIMSGNPNAGNLLGVNGYDARNTDRRNLFSAAPMQVSNQYYASQNQQSTFPEFEVSNPQAFFTPLSFYEMPVQQEMQQPLVDIAEEYAKAQKAAERAERRQGLNNLMTVLSLTSPSNEGNDLYSGIMPLVSMANMSAYGRHLYDGETEPTNQMHRVNPRYLSEQVTVEGRNAKVLGADYERNTAIVQYDDGTTETVRPAKDFWTVPNNVVLGSKELKDNQYRTMPTNSEANAFADTWTGQTAPTIGDLVTAGTKSFDLFMPHKYVGLLDSDNKNGFLHLFDEDNKGLFINDNPNGMFSKRYAEEHPYWAMAGNMAFDIPTSMAAGWTIGKGYNAANNAYNAGKASFDNWSRARQLSRAINGDVGGTVLNIREPIGGVFRAKLGDAEIGEPNYGWRKTAQEPALSWEEAVNGNVTDNLLKWLERPLSYSPQSPLSEMSSSYAKFYPEHARMAKLWRDKGVDLNRVGIEDVKNAFEKRWDELLSSTEGRRTIARPVGENSYYLHDGVPDNNIHGWKNIGTTDIEKDASGNMHMRNIDNNTESVRRGIKATEHGVQERGLNAAIQVAKDEGGEGVITGEHWLSAPKQQHVAQKYRDREVVGNTGEHSNINMVEERINNENAQDDYMEYPAKSMLDLRRADDKIRKVLFNQPYWLLRTPTYRVPVKSTLFDPSIIDRFGKMHIDWSNPNVFKGIAIPTMLGFGIQSMDNN